MLLLTDKKGEHQITIKELSEKLKIPVEKLQKNRRFELNESFNGVDLGNSDEQRRNVKKSPKGISKPAVFTFRDSEGYDCSLRYCTQVPHPKRTNDGIVNVYTPRKVRVEGEGTHAQDNDLAVWLYLSPSNRQSPVRNSTYWLWQHYDSEEIADNTIESVDRLFEALTHVNGLTVENMIVFAKGLGIATEGKSAKELRAHLSIMAKNNPEDYLKKSKQEIIRFDGLVQDAIDRGIFILETIHGNTFWTWSSGPYKGNEIVHIRDKNRPASATLKDFLKLKENISVYWAELNKAHQRSVSDDDAETFLREVNSTEAATVPTPADANKLLPKTFAEGMSYLKNLHPDNLSPSNVNCSKFMKAIENGEINYENIENEAKQYMNRTGMED